MTPRIKQMLRNIGRQAGLEVRISGPNSRDDLRLLSFLKSKNIDTVLDVGANNGGFAKMLLKAGFKGQIFSFEPLPRAHAQLVTAAEGVDNWSVAPRLALSNENGLASFNITQADTSSSLLQPSDSFVLDTPQVRVSEVIEVPTCRLDDVHGIRFNPSRTLLKLDVQGAEDKVLAGAEKSLEKMRGILCEMSLIPLYVGQPDWVAIDRIISEYGFDIWDLWPGHRSLDTFRLLQLDGLYFRNV